MVGCHRQADRTTDRLRASVLRFGLLTKDQVRQSFAKKVDHHLDFRVDRRHIQTAVEVEHYFPVGKSLNPKLRNFALIQFEGFLVGVVGEDQGVEAVFIVDLALYPRSASGAVAVADLGDCEVEVVFGHFVSVVGLVNRFRVNTHEPCGSNRIKAVSEGFRNLFFGAYLCSEMLGELRCVGLHISQFVEELFHVRWLEAARIGITSIDAYSSLTASSARRCALRNWAEVRRGRLVMVGILFLLSWFGLKLHLR